MNHRLVVNSQSAKCPYASLGVNAMDLLINALVRSGANRRNLHAKVLGGAKMISPLSDIGRGNAGFVRDFLNRERIPCLGKSIGKVHARQLRFHPTDGRVLLKPVASGTANIGQRLAQQVPPLQVLDGFRSQIDVGATTLQHGGVPRGGLCFQSGNLPGDNLNQQIDSGRRARRVVIVKIGRPAADPQESDLG
ncbi:chemotaxis protein CheD [Pseudooceanicola sp.]|uniref:chemotaxis protein CheD n=1 Tax=Pseudooceanicola sp. TaxID=1914328 RepID=UPI0026364F74|nr:chemotaxis protein CheD [Pseudooceanicola sp.]MDF1854076.1 chemotaxis protein CheD [Pseudooceanicola sp.]